MSFKPIIYRLIGALWSPRLRLPHVDPGNRVSIFCLHGVHDTEMEKIAPPPTSSVSVKSLEANLRSLARYHTVISLAEAMDMLDGKTPWRPRCAVLTFDDSLACTVDVAAPILRQMNMTATVFISTDAIETQIPYWWLRLDYSWLHGRRSRAEVLTANGEMLSLELGDKDSLRKGKAVLRRTEPNERERLVDQLSEGLGAILEDPTHQFPYARVMNWDEVRALVEMGFGIGSHTVTHPNLTLLTKGELTREVSNSKITIESALNQPCLHFCYPYGIYNKVVSLMCEEAGYKVATSTISPGINRLGQSSFDLRRYSMPAAAWKLGYLLSGFPDFLSSLRPSPKSEGSIGNQSAANLLDQSLNER